MSGSLALLKVPPDGEYGLVGAVGVSPGFSQVAVRKTNDSHRSCRRCC
jgi:hypothetical protein